MNCPQFENRIQQLLDERLSPCSDEQLVLHAGGCAYCALKLSAHKAIQSAFVAGSTDWADDSAGKQMPAGVNTLADRPDYSIGRYRIDRPSRPSAVQTVKWIIGTAAAAMLAFVLFVVPALIDQSEKNNVESTAKSPVASIGSPQPSQATTPAPGEPVMIDSDSAQPQIVPIPDLTQLDVIATVNAPFKRLSEIPRHLVMLGPYYNMTSEVPGVGSFWFSIDFAIDLLRESILPSDDGTPPVR